MAKTWEILGCDVDGIIICFIVLFKNSMSNEIYMSTYYAGN